VALVGRGDRAKDGNIDRYLARLPVRFNGLSSEPSIEFTLPPRLATSKVIVSIGGCEKMDAEETSISLFAYYKRRTGCGPHLNCQP
jgi:hypothetical protein